jgi:hypothetical protein
MTERPFVVDLSNDWGTTDVDLPPRRSAYCTVGRMRPVTPCISVDAQAPRRAVGARRRLRWGGAAWLSALRR